MLCSFVRSQHTSQHIFCLVSVDFLFSRDAAILLQAWERLPTAPQRVLSPSLIPPSIAFPVSPALSFSQVADNAEHGNVKDILLAFLWAWSGFVSLCTCPWNFVVYHFWQSFYDDGFCCPFLNIVYSNEIWCLKDLFLSISSSMKQIDISRGSEWQQITWHLFASVFCAGWPFRWISLILTACPWWTMMHCDWLQYASRKRRDSRSREVSSTARWTSTGPSYPLLKPAVLITLSLTLSSWHYSETENTRVIWVAQLNKSSVFKEVELRQYPNHGKITEIHSLALHMLIENSCFYLHFC